jgi:catechol 2,3-dioxygenase-like lactoylglutathione lyase family enzyme
MTALTDMVGFVATTDYDKARAFYERNLGFQFVSLDQYALVMTTGKNLIRITKLQGFVPAQYTVLGWEVQNIEAVVAALMEQGVAFEEYPFIQDRELRVWTAPSGDKVAWFKDPDGNVLSISEHK